MKRIGITTTVPMEVIFASGNIPVDLNNIFITDEDATSLVEKAEERGFPRNSCAWIKGIYTAALKSQVDIVIGVSEGDCSNTHALLEVLKKDGVEVLDFRFPRQRNAHRLAESTKQLSQSLGASPQEINKVWQALRGIRRKLGKLDQLTVEGKVTGFENHLWQVSASDFNGDYRQFEKDLDQKIVEISRRDVKRNGVRLGYIGVPPIIGNLYSEIEEMAGMVVFNEVQRQFTLADGIETNLLEGYLNYFTYPYSLEHRLKDINKQIKLRDLDGLIHYTQSFCYRAIEDIVIRDMVDIPVLKLEADKPGQLDGRNKLRLEAFIDMLGDMRRIKG